MARLNIDLADIQALYLEAVKKREFEPLEVSSQGFFINYAFLLKYVIVSEVNSSLQDDSLGAQRPS
jgi:hypothetical protein